MDEDEVQKQLDHMVKFIYREADEKAKEIRDKALEEFSIEKNRIVREEKERLKREFEKKEKQIEVQKKIAYSNELNQSRLSVLKARDEGIKKLAGESLRRLITVGKDVPSYKKLVQGLIVQGLMKLQENKVSVVCRQEDISLVKDILSAAVEEYKTKCQRNVDLDIDTKNFLPPAPVDLTSSGNFCCGGVILTSNEGRIICKNTLEVRLEMALEQKLPEIRRLLFGESTTRVHKD